MGGEMERAPRETHVCQGVVKTDVCGWFLCAMHL